MGQVTVSQSDNFLRKESIVEQERCGKDIVIKDNCGPQLDPGSNYRKTF